MQLFNNAVIIPASAREIFYLYRFIFRHALTVRECHPGSIQAETGFTVRFTDIFYSKTCRLDGDV